VERFVLCICFFKDGSRDGCVRIGSVSDDHRAFLLLRTFLEYLLCIVVLDVRLVAQHLVVRVAQELGAAFS